MNIENDYYRNKVLKIWEDHNFLEILNEPGCEYRKSPILPGSIKKNAILFIGINPSFTNGSIIPNDKKDIQFYHLEEGEQQIPYFQKFQDIADYCEESWTHLDMLFIRETNQKIIDNLSKTKEGVKFITEQVNLVFEIIAKSNPKIIIVSNAFATELFGKKKGRHHNFDSIWKGFSLEFPRDFNEKIGTYTIKLNEYETPVIFSGMLSGQRALDIGSLERLKWQTKRIIKN